MHGVGGDEPLKFVTQVAGQGHVGVAPGAVGVGEDGLEQERFQRHRHEPVERVARGLEHEQPSVAALSGDEPGEVEGVGCAGLAPEVERVRHRRCGEVRAHGAGGGEHAPVLALDLGERGPVRGESAQQVAALAGEGRFGPRPVGEVAGFGADRARWTPGPIDATPRIKV